jgi:hypothetical protein
MAVAPSGAADGPDPVEASLAHELEFSWVHSSWLALQRDLGTRLVPGVTEAVARLEALRASADVPAAPVPAPEPDARSRPDGAAADLRQRLEAAEQDRSRLSAEAAAAHAQIAALRGSWSWRLAAPLRAGHRLLGLGRR